MELVDVQITYFLFNKEVLDGHPAFKGMTMLDCHLKQLVDELEDV